MHCAKNRKKGKLLHSVLQLKFAYVDMLSMVLKFVLIIYKLFQIIAEMFHSNMELTKYNGVLWDESLFSQQNEI